MSREYWFNADFDLSLRPRWRGPADAAEARRIEELGFHALAIARPEDSILLPEVLPDEFRAYLEGLGVPLPGVSVEPEIRAGARLAPFGWNVRAQRLSERYGQPSLHPPLNVVRRVNGRSFGLAVAGDLGERDFDLGSHACLAAIEDCLERARRREGGWVIKALHGNAALANRRIRTRAFTAADRKWLAAQLAEDDSVVVEPWCERLVDLCATFDVSREGGESGLNLHEVVNTADGAFIGAVFEQRSPVIAPWREAMAEAATRVAERLAGAGYFGPVCVDSFVWQSSGGPRLRRLVDLNARLHISAPILRLWRQLAPHSVAYWRFFTRRKLDLPASYDDLAAALAGDAYEPGAGRGVMLTSPLWLVGDGRPRRPHKLGVLFLDETRDGVLALAYRFRHRFEK